MSTLGKFKRRWFGPFRVHYCLPNNIIIFISLNNFEPNMVLVNVNKLKPYKYVDQTLNKIKSSNNQMSLKSIDSNHMEKKSNEDSKDQRKIEIIGTHQIIISKEA
jgi:hypothetical protein